MYTYIYQNKTKVYKHTWAKSYTHTKKEKHTKIQYEQKQFQIDMSQRQSQLWYIGSEQSELFSHMKSGQTCGHNRKIMLIPLLIMFHMHITNRITEIDQKNTWVCSASNEKLFVMLRKWKSATRVTSSNLWVTISNSRVTSLNPRVTRLKARVARLKAQFGWLKTRVRRLKARVEAIKPRVK